MIHVAAALTPVCGVHITRRRQRGLSLVELMIAITLGMVAVAGAISIYLANRNSYKLVEGAARLQENARFAAEFIGRDLREAGGIVCGGNLVQENVLDATNLAQWWGDWSTGLKGYASNSTYATDLPTTSLAKFGTTAGDRRPGTDAFIVWNASAGSPSTLTQDSSGATFNVYPAPSSGSVSVFTACDDIRVSTFTLKPTGRLLLTADQTPTTAIKQGGFLNQLSASAWYICKGQNASSPYSLCRESLQPGPSSPTSSAKEVVENVTGMQITYLLGDGNGAPAATSSDYVGDDIYSDWTAAQWANVQAVRVKLTLATPDNVGSATSGANAPLSQDFVFTVAIRRRLP